MTLAWKFISSDMSVCHRAGERWMVCEWREVEGEIVACERGYHASVKARDALTYESSECRLLARVEYEGEVVGQTDKIAARRMRVLWIADPAAQRRAILGLCYRWVNRAIARAVAALRSAGLGTEADTLSAVPAVTCVESAESAARAARAAAESAAWAAGAARAAAESAAVAAWAAGAARAAAESAAGAARAAAESAAESAAWAARAAAEYAAGAAMAAGAAEQQTQESECEAAFAALEPEDVPNA